MSLKIRINDASKSKREKDGNGFLIIRDNPIVKAGVFDYLLSEIKNDIDSSKDKVVKVCRTFDDLKSKKDYFKGKPIKFEHKWVGSDFGSDINADGAIFGEVREQEPYLIADLIIYNTELINKIENGEVVELSPGYDATFENKGGTYNGDSFEFNQILQNVNHLAVVETGRSGSDLRIFDKKPNQGDLTMKITDAIYKALKRIKDEEIEVETKTQDEDKREIIREIMAISAKPDSDFDGGEDEKVETISKLAEKLAYNPSETSKTDDSDDEVEVKSKDDDFIEEEKEKIEIKPEDLVELIEKVADKKFAKMQDSLNKEAKKISDAYKEVSSVLGTSFDFSGKSASEIYAFGAKCLNNGIKVDDSFDAVTAFRMLANSKKQHITTSDVKVGDSQSSNRFDNMLKNFK